MITSPYLRSTDNPKVFKVFSPDLQKSAYLPKCQAITYALLAEAAGSGVTTVEFQRQGLLSPSANVQALKHKGLSIEKVSCTEFDVDGVPHHNIARYFLVGVAK